MSQLDMVDEVLSVEERVKRATKRADSVAEYFEEKGVEYGSVAYNIKAEGCYGVCKTMRLHSVPSRFYHKVIVPGLRHVIKQNRLHFQVLDYGKQPEEERQLYFRIEAREDY